MQSVRKALYAGCVMALRRQALYAGCVMAVVFLTSCSTPYSIYSRNVFEGKRLYQFKEYAQARQAFLSAYETEKNVTALAWAATTSYWLNDLTSAETYIRQAEPKARKSVSYFRVTGYKALILLKQGKKDEGLQTLKEYVYAYGHTYISSNLPWIDLMIKTGDVDIPKLQAMLEEDIYAYEEAIGEFESTGTGYYDRNPGAGGGNVP
jgi:tetratricopeptide (TPR) repeat protein